MNVWRIFTIAVLAIFSFFLRKIVEIVKRNFNQTRNGQQNSRKHVLWAINDVSTTDDAICAAVMGINYSKSSLTTITFSIT